MDNIGTSMNNNNLIRLQNIVANQLGIEPWQITPTADFGKELGADSLDVIELVMTIEDEFGIEIEDVAASKISTIREALDYIERELYGEFL